MRQDVVGAVDLAVLRSLGDARIVPGFPQARLIGSTLFVETSSIATISFASLWRSAFPVAPAPTGAAIGLLIDPSLARQFGLQWIKLGPAETRPSRSARDSMASTT